MFLRWLLFDQMTLGEDDRMASGAPGPSGFSAQCIARYCGFVRMCPKNSYNENQWKWLSFLVWRGNFQERLKDPNRNSPREDWEERHLDLLLSLPQSALTWNASIRDLLLRLGAPSKKPAVFDCGIAMICHDVWIPVGSITDHPYTMVLWWDRSPITRIPWFLLKAMHTELQMGTASLFHKL